MLASPPPPFFFLQALRVKPSGTMRKSIKRVSSAAHDPRVRDFMTGAPSAGSRLLRVSMYPRAQPTEASPAWVRDRQARQYTLPLLNTHYLCAWWLLLNSLEPTWTKSGWFDSGAAGWGCTPVVHWLIKAHRLSQPSTHTLCLYKVSNLRD